MYHRIVAILETTYIHKRDEYVCPMSTLDAIEELLEKHNVNWKSQLAAWPDLTGGAATVAFIDPETGELEMIGWDYLV